MHQSSRPLHGVMSQQCGDACSVQLQCTSEQKNILFTHVHGRYLLKTGVARFYLHTPPMTQFPNEDVHKLTDILSWSSDIPPTNNCPTPSSYSPKNQCFYLLPLRLVLFFPMFFLHKQLVIVAKDPLSGHFV